MPRFFVRFLLLACLLAAEAETGRTQSTPPAKETRPCTLQTNGRQMTIRSRKTLHRVMLWTPEGHRLAEYRDINSSTLTLDIPVYRKIYFLMVTFSDGKVWTEKVAVN